MPPAFLGETKNGCKVYVDMEVSHAATHFADDPHLLDLVKEALSKIEPTEDMVRMEIDMGRIVGDAGVVETDEGDDIVYAMRPHRERYSRFVKNKSAEPTQYITLNLRKKGEKLYYLYTAFIGKLVPSFPGGDYLPEQSREFWSKHALIWGKQVVVPGTETKRCPW